MREGGRGGGGPSFFSFHPQGRWQGCGCGIDITDKVYFVLIRETAPNSVANIASCKSNVKNLVKLPIAGYDRIIFANE